MKFIPLFFYLLFFSCGVFGQSAFATASSALCTQLSVYPQGKVYVHTDKDFYRGGDTLWFRAFVVDATTHAALCASRYVYAELQSSARPASGDPGPAPVRLRLLERHGIYAGYFALPLTAQGGDYTLTAYTGFIRNAGVDYFFRKNST